MTTSTLNNLSFAGQTALIHAITTELRRVSAKAQNYSARATREGYEPAKNAADEEWKAFNELIEVAHMLGITWVNELEY